MKKHLQPTPHLTILLVATIVTGCGKENERSTLDYLTESDEPCIQYDEQRMNQIRALPANFVSGYSGGQQDVALNRLAGITDRDMNHLLWTFKNGTLQGVRAAVQFPGVAGVTQLRSGKTEGGFGGMIAVSIQTGPTQAGFAMQHEVGHAVEVKAREAAQKTAYANFDGALNSVMSELNSKGNLIRGYAKSQPGEAFAESYANFYCSPATQRFIQDNLPTTYKFLRAVLEPARWEAVAPTPPPPPLLPSPQRHHRQQNHRHRKTLAPLHRLKVKTLARINLTTLMVATRLVETGLTN